MCVPTEVVPPHSPRNSRQLMAFIGLIDHLTSSVHCSRFIACNMYGAGPRPSSYGGSGGLAEWDHPSRGQLPTMYKITDQPWLLNFLPGTAVHSSVNLHSSSSTRLQDESQPSLPRGTCFLCCIATCRFHSHLAKLYRMRK